MKTAKILVVDDERSVRQALRFELEDAGYEVIYATDYNEALSALRAFELDMVISDVFLGKGNGLQLQDILSRENHGVPMIAISAFPESDLGLRAKHVFKDCFYEKPFVMPLLKEKIQELLGKRAAAFAV